MIFLSGYFSLPFFRFAAPNISLPLRSFICSFPPHLLSSYLLSWDISSIYTRINSTLFFIISFSSGKTQLSRAATCSHRLWLINPPLPVTGGLLSVNHSTNWLLVFMLITATVSLLLSALWVKGYEWIKSLKNLQVMSQVFEKWHPEHLFILRFCSTPELNIDKCAIMLHYVWWSVINKAAATQRRFA